MLGFGYGILLFTPASPLLYAFPIIYLAAAVGLLLARRWSWILSITLAAISTGLNIAQEIFMPGFGPFLIVVLPVSLVVLFYLASPDVRRFFDSVAR